MIHNGRDHEPGGMIGKRMKQTLLTGLGFLLLLPAVSLGEPEEVDRAKLEHFESKIRPVLVERCAECHSRESGNSEGGLYLDSPAGMLAGGSLGPVIVPGKPEESLLIRAIKYADEDLQMPPDDHGGKLPDVVIADFEAWIRSGAVDPRDDVVPPAKDMEAARRHWAFQPLKPPPVPKAVWPDNLRGKFARRGNELDAFIVAKLQEHGIQPGSMADRRTLIRRVTYDMTGLPPTFEQVEEFLNDTADDAYEKVVERLLASAAYGERWGRHWLDVARYADTRGYLAGNAEERYAFAHTYRDYVIRAFNEDKPYDEFVREQIAADQLDLGDDRSSLAAMGFLTLGRRFLGDHKLIIDDRIDVVTRGLLGLTVSCARCHDHKFDPIPTADYYSLYGVFASSFEPRELPLLEQSPSGELYDSYMDCLLYTSPSPRD